MNRQNVIALNVKRQFAAEPIAGQCRYDDLSELECSDYGRDPRLLPGWWIMPTCLITLLSYTIYLTA